MPLWNPVTANSYATGVLWTPDLSLTLMGRDFANFFTAWSWAMTSVNCSQTTTPVKLADIGVCFPDSWDADSVYPCQMRISLDFTTTCQGTEDPGIKWSDQCTFFLKYGTTAGPDVVVSASGTATASVTGSPSCVVDLPQGSLPTGPATVEIWQYGEFTQNWSIARAFSANPTSWYGFVIV